MVSSYQPQPVTTPKSAVGKPLRLLVCGGRDFEDFPAVCRALDPLRASPGIDMLVHGNARGADMLAEWWARAAGVRSFPVPAQWAKHGKRAGPIRNQQMLGMGIDLVVAFPGGRGTADMVKRAKAADVPVLTPLSVEGTKDA